MNAEYYEQLENLVRALIADTEEVARLSKFAPLPNGGSLEDRIYHIQAAERVIQNTRRLRRLLGDTENAETPSSRV